MLKPGDLHFVRDEIIGFPETRSGQDRELHRTRPVLLLSNERVCRDKIEPVIIVAPLSHLTELKTSCDLFIKTDSENKLPCNSRLILSHIQPILKIDLLDRLGSMNAHDFERIKAQLVWMFGLDEDDE
jgi:hypothetical protein